MRATILPHRFEAERNDANRVYNLTELWILKNALAIAKANAKEDAKKL